MMHVVIDQEILVPWKCSDKKNLFMTRKKSTCGDTTRWNLI